MSKFPSFYDPASVGQRFVPRILEVLQIGAKAGIKPVRGDAKDKQALVLVDDQDDFVLEDGCLSVKGAVDDVKRIIEFIYTNPEEIDTIMMSLDQHIPFQIFFGLWWVNREGNHPDPYTLISADDVTSGVWRPLIMKQWSIDYVKKLGEIMIWGPHCMIGTVGSGLVSALAEAIAWLASARNIQPTYVFKGTVPQSEHYGIFQPCVLVPTHPQGGVNTVVLDTLAEHKLIRFAGEAADFCVKQTMLQFLEYFGDRPDVLKKVQFLQDCTSLVFPDQTDAYEQFLNEMRSKEVQIVNSTD